MEVTASKCNQIFESLHFANQVQEKMEINFRQASVDMFQRKSKMALSQQFRSYVLVCVLIFGVYACGNMVN